MIPASFRLLPHWRLLLLLSLSLAAGCGKTPPSAYDADTPAPRFTGKDIEFPRGNPQLSNLQIVQPRPFKQTGENFTGRVTWDEGRDRPGLLTRGRAGRKNRGRGRPDRQERR